MWVEGVAKNLLQEEHVAAIVLNLRNVTERIVAEEKLVASENQFRSRLDNMIEGIQIHDFSWRYVYVNDALLRYTSFKKEDLIGFSLKEIYPGIENSDLFKTMQQCMNERLSVQTETEFVHPDGKVAFYQLSIKPVPEGIFILSIDITNRKKAERELIQSEENLKAIFDNSSEGFVLTDTEGIIKAVNTKANNPLLQYATGEIKIGQSIFNSTEPERQDFLTQIFARIINGETIEYNRLYNAPNAQQCWINYIYSPVKKNNTIQGVCITGRDITTRKLAEQQKEFDRNNLDALINNTADCIWSVDLNFNLITSNKAFNDRFEKLTGQMIEKGSNVLSEYFDSLQLEHYKNYYKYCFSGDAFTVVEHLKKPENRWSEISFQPIYEADKVIGAACFARDITQRKKIEQELKNSLKEKRALLNRMSAIINTLPANIALLDNKAVILDVNDSWRNFADNNKFIGKNYCIGQNYIDISNKLVKKENEDGPKVAIGIDAVLKGKLKEFVFEYECHSPEKERWFRMIVTPLQKEEYSGAVVMHIDISALRSLEKERLNAKTEAHQKITQAILLGQEKERNHIGRELHDNVNQILAASKLYLSSAANKNGDIKELLKYPLELLEISIEEIRLLCVNLVTPLRITSLKELTIGLLSKIQQSAAIETAYIYDVPENLLADELKLNVYRVLQELTNNIIKYAKAQKVSITINLTGKNLQIEITDDGVGFNINNSRKGIGISNIISRMESFNGKVNIISSPGNGCKTIITVPY
jgi:PAS domain S-box-containing protein